MHMNKIKSGWNGVRRVAYRRRFDDFFPPVTFGPSVAFDVNGFIIVPPRSLYSSSLFPQTPRHHRPMRFQIHRVLLPFPDDTLYACMYMYVCICIRLADVLLLLLLLPPCPKKPSLSPFSAGRQPTLGACLLAFQRAFRVEGLKARELRRDIYIYILHACCSLCVERERREHRACFVFSLVLCTSPSLSLSVCACE